MGILIECLPEIIDNFTHGAAEESTVGNMAWGVFKAYAFFYISVVYVLNRLCGLFGSIIISNIEMMPNDAKKIFIKVMLCHNVKTMHKNSMCP